jgi:hypothetical protein
MDKTNIREVFGKKTNILQVMTRLRPGIAPYPGDPHWTGKCPLNNYPFIKPHTLKIYPDENRFSCSQCKVSGDGFDFLVQVARLSADQAKEWLSKEFHIPPSLITTESEIIDAALDKLSKSIRCQTQDVLKLLATSEEPRSASEWTRYEKLILKRLKAETGMNLGKLRQLFQETRNKS